MKNVKWAKNRWWSIMTLIYYYVIHIKSQFWFYFKLKLFSSVYIYLFIFLVSLTIIIIINNYSILSVLLTQYCPHTSYLLEITSIFDNNLIVYVQNCFNRIGFKYCVFELRLFCNNIYKELGCGPNIFLKTLNYYWANWFEFKIFFDWYWSK